jgi:hypothetical protein
MGGRVYDPLIGRFLSRDPYIDGVDSSQGANGYGYVHNNPLSRWDPTGYGAEDLDEIVVTGRRSRWRSVFLEEFARFLSQPFAGGAPAGGGGPGGTDGAAAPPAEPTDGGREEPQSEPPPCEYGLSTASGSVTAGGYAGKGGEVTAGLDNGHSFVTSRSGFGFGGGISFNPRGGMPIRPADQSTGGVISSVTMQFSLSAGVPSTTLAGSVSVEWGVAYSSRDGFGWVGNVDPAVGALADKGLRATGSAGGQITVYSAPTTTITSTETCRAHW